MKKLVAAVITGIICGVGSNVRADDEVYTFDAGGGAMVQDVVSEDGSSSRTYEMDPNENNGYSYDTDYFDSEGHLIGSVEHNRGFSRAAEDEMES